MSSVKESAHRMALEMRGSGFCARYLGDGMMAFVDPVSRRHRFAPYDFSTLLAARDLGLVEPRNIKVLHMLGQGHGQIEEFDLYAAK